MGVENYYSSLSGNGIGRKSSNPKNDVVIGGINFGRNWSDADAAALQQAQLQASIDQQIAMIEDERRYNSYSAQAQRMRAAGLNPDMQNFEGTNSSGGISAGVGSPSGESRSALNAHITQSIGSMVDIIPQAIGIYQQIKTGSLNNAVSEAQLSKLAKGEALDLIGSNVTLDDLKDKTSVPHVSTNHIASRKYSKLVNKYLDDFLLDSSNRSIAEKAIYDNMISLDNSRTTYSKGRSNPSFSEDDNLFISALRKLWEMEEKAKYSKDKYDNDYFSNKDGSFVADSEESILSNQVTSTSTQANSLDKVFDDELSKLWKSGDRWDKALAAVLYLVKSLAGNISFGPKGFSGGSIGIK